MPFFARLTTWQGGGVVGIAAVLYLAVLGPWFFTSRGVEDVGIIANAAARILAGQVPYRDFFLFIGPLSPYLTAAWFALAGHSALSMIGLTVVVGALTALGTYWIARFLAPTGAALLAGLGFLTLGPYFWFTLSHHWFATLLLVLATIFVLQAMQSGRIRWVAAAAAACVAAAFAHQARGLIGLLALLLLVGLLFKREARKRGLASAVIAAVATTLVLVAPLLLAEGPGPLLRDLLWFVVTKYPKANREAYMAFDLIPSAFLVAPAIAVLQASVAWLALAIGPLGVILLALHARTAARAGRTVHAQMAGTVTILGLATWSGVLYQPSAVHVGYVSPWFICAWVVIVSAALGSERAAVRRAARLGLAAVSTAWLAFFPVAQWVAILGGAIVWSWAPSGWVPLGTAQDAAMFSGSFPEVSTFLMAHTHAGDPVVFYPYRSVNNVLLDRINPLNLDFVFASENTDAQVEQVVAVLTVSRRAKYVVIESGPAEIMAKKGAERGPTQAGVEALDALRTRLPLVFATDNVEVRSAQ